MTAADVHADWLPVGRRDDWARFVATSPTGSAYSLPAYLVALSRAAGGRFRVLGAQRGSELLGGVAVYERDTPLGPTVRPRLLLYYNGLVLREEATAYPSQRSSRHVTVATALAQALEAEGFRRVELRTRAPFADARPFQARGWAAEPSYSYVVALDDLEAQWARTEHNLRRLVGRCQRAGFELEPNGDFHAFYELHAGTHERTGAPVYLPEDRFARFYEELREQGLCRLYHALAPGGQVAASQLVLLGHPVTHTVAAGTSSEFAKSGAAAFLRWKVFEHLAAEGYRGNDLTDASLNPVTHFKSQLGGELRTALVLTRTTLRDRGAGLVRSAGRRVRARLRRP